MHDPVYFDLRFPGAAPVPALPGQFVDVSARVVRAEVDLRTPAIGDPNVTQVASVPGQPNAVVVGWPGGTCDKRADLELGGAGGRVFTLKLLSDFGGCQVDVVPRRVLVTFREAVDAGDFVLDVVR